MNRVLLFPRQINFNTLFLQRALKNSALCSCTSRQPVNVYSIIISNKTNDCKNPAKTNFVPTGPCVSHYSHGMGYYSNFHGEFQSLALILLIYMEFLLLIITAYLMNIRRSDSYYGVKYYFNGEGILVNKHLVYPWTEVKSVFFRKLTERFTLKQFSAGNSRLSLRELDNVPTRNGKLVPIYRTFSYGNIEVFSDFGRRLSVIIKCPPSYFKARRMFSKMKKYSASLNPSINFHIQRN